MFDPYQVLGLPADCAIAARNLTRREGCERLEASTDRIIGTVLSTDTRVTRGKFGFIVVSLC